MSNNEKDDWHDDSAALFRSARRAHDPTPAERAAFARVLTGIQGAQPAATMGSGRASHAAKSMKLVEVAKVALAVLGVAAAYFAFGRADRDSSAPTARTAAAAIAPAASPAPVPRAEPIDLQPTRVARREDALSIPELPRRSRASAGRKRPSTDERTIVAETPKRSESAPQLSTTNAVAATREPARRESSLESNVPPAVSPATTPALAAPQQASTELAVLKRMQAALRAADFTTALALCAEHERRWPHGTFELERKGVRAIAACGVSSDDALPLAKAFLAQHPYTAVAMRVSSACGIPAAVTTVR